MEANNKIVKQKKRRDQRNSTKVKEIVREDSSRKLIKNIITDGSPHEPDEVDGTGETMSINNNFTSKKHLNNGSICNQTLVRDQVGLGLIYLSFCLNSKSIY